MTCLTVYTIGAAIVSTGALTFAPTVASFVSSGETSQRNRMALAETIRTIGAHSSPLRSSSTNARAAQCYSRVARRCSTTSRTASGAPGRIFDINASARNVSDSSS